MFYTMLESEDGSVIYVPNGSITGGVITNKTTPPCIRTVRPEH
jgi:small-conductance mechanosensitive channel